ncbi:MAG: hypothetical protein JJU13_13460 [Balneolaceae bacterium]|nr:hypothetical protein [Balneolaceae bacterium]
MSDDQQHIVIVTTRVGGSDYHHQKKKQKFPDDESTGLLYFPCFQHSVWPSQLPLIGIQIFPKPGFFDVKSTMSLVEVQESHQTSRSGIIPIIFNGLFFEKLVR